MSNSTDHPPTESSASGDSQQNDDQKPMEANEGRQIELNADLSLLTPEEREERKRALRSMLAASEARSKNANRGKVPTPSVGLAVVIRSVSDENRSGVILDADYIHNRALIQLNDNGSQVWVDFTELKAEDSAS